MPKYGKGTFWGLQVKDDTGRVIGYEDECGAIRTQAGLLAELGCCIMVLVAFAGAVAGCGVYTYKKVQKYRVQRAASIEPTVATNAVINIQNVREK